MDDQMYELAKVVSFPNEIDRSSRQMRKIMSEDEEVKRFFRFVYNNDLREEALSLLEARLNKHEV